MSHTIAQFTVFPVTEQVEYLGLDVDGGSLLSKQEFPSIDLEVTELVNH